MATNTTPNGWAVLKPDDRRLLVLHVPGTRLRFTGRNDQLGFMAAWWASWWNDNIEPLPVGDTGCYSYRENTTAAAFWSEHAACAAVDCRWTQHPQGVPISRTFTKREIRKIRAVVRFLDRVARGPVATWGGEWPTHPGSTALTDGMHVQFIHGRVLRLVRVLAKNPRGRAVLAANPGLRIKGVTH